MAPHGILREEKSSSNSVTFETNSDSENEGILPSNCSQNSTPELGSQSSNEATSSQLSVNHSSQLNSSSESLSNGTLSNLLPQLAECKSTPSPVKLLNSFIHNESNCQDYTGGPNAIPAEFIKTHQQVLDFLHAQASVRDQMSCIPSLECSTDDGALTDPSHCGSKVVVQAMPVVEFGSNSALHECFDDIRMPRKSWSHLESGVKKSVPADFEGSKNVASKLSVKRKSEVTPSSYSVKKMQKKGGIDKPGRGTMLYDIDGVASSLSMASTSMLRALHYVLFDRYGCVRNDSSIEQTKGNILRFSGFEFDKLSENCAVKYKCLMRMPYALLSEIYGRMLNRSSADRPVIVEQLLDFLLKPTRRNGSVTCFKESAKISHNSVTEELKNRILKGPSPVVKLERLSDGFIRRMLNAKYMYENSEVYDQVHPKNYVKPLYIKRGPGKKLKSFPHVVEGIYAARRRIINLLHSFLYGRPGSEEWNRSNILEFSGFLKHGTCFLQRRVAVLNRYKKVELEQICDIFCVNEKRGNKMSKIAKLLFYLQAPSLIVNPKRKSTAVPSTAENRSTQPSMMHAEVLCNPVKSVVPKLKDFEEIANNIECAPPGALTELNDLLFQAPCDVTEIHEKVLNFTAFQFDKSSNDYRSRKTLMHYMGFEAVRKIACILGIPDWEQYSTYHDLGEKILEFLMEMKKPDKVRKKKNIAPCSRRVKRQKKVPDSNIRPHILTVQKDKNQSFSNVGRCHESAPSDMRNSMCSSNGFHQHGKTEDVSNSTVVIQRISDSSYSWKDSTNEGPLTISNHNSDESIPLCDLVHHPTENQLELTIKEVICANSLQISLGDLLNRVFHHYPKFNLAYRTDFIKSKALLILQEMQECMVDSTLDSG